MSRSIESEGASEREMGSHQKSITSDESGAKKRESEREITGKEGRVMRGGGGLGGETETRLSVSTSLVLSSSHRLFTL